MGPGETVRPVGAEHISLRQAVYVSTRSNNLEQVRMSDEQSVQFAKPYAD